MSETATAASLVAEDEFTITMGSIVRYAGASGDFTAIHYDAEVLAAAGYDRFFAMGMLTAGRLGALVAQTFGDEAVRRLQVRFRSRAWLGSRVRLTITRPDDDRHHDDPDQLTVLLSAVADGEVIVNGLAVVTRPTTKDQP